MDLNPHQIEAALFAFRSPLSRGALLADEVGLGKTIEAGSVLSQKWAERKRRILIITPSNLRKQWHQEMQEKFFLPCRILETRSYNGAIKQGNLRPFDVKDSIAICSYQFARNKASDVSGLRWDLVVIDEAHRLRNVYKPSNVIANTLKMALKDMPKLLLTATPLQNSLLELFGLVSVIDQHTFGDLKIDDYEMPYLRVLMDEVCARTSFVATNVWQKRYSRENREAIGDVHEHVLVYAKEVNRFKAARNRIPITEAQAKIYKNPNKDPKGRWRGIPMTAQEYRPNQMYSITTPTGIIHTPPEGRCWSMIESEFLRLKAEGRIWFGTRGDSQPNVIRHLSEVEGMIPWTWWPSDEVGHTDESKKEIHALFGKEDAFATPKPERLVQRIIQIASSPGDWVLDSFAGSGTTGAVAHKMGRRWIMVELGEHCHTHIIPRMKKVIDGTDQGGITEAVNWKGGGGFRYYRLAPSLLEKDKWGNWVINNQYNAAMLAKAICKLEGFVYSPSDSIYWQHGHSTELDFIYVTTQNLNHDQLQALNE